MIWIYFILLLVGGGMRYFLSKIDGLLPYRYGISVFCLIFDIFLLINSIYLFGFWIGILIFALHFFGILDLFFTWPIDVIPFFKSYGFINLRLQIYGSWIAGFVTYLFVPAMAAFCIVSFFLFPYKSMLLFFSANALIVLGISAAIGIILGIVIKSIVHKDNPRL